MLGPEDDPNAPVGCAYCEQSEGTEPRDGHWLCLPDAVAHDAVETLADALVNLS